MRLVGLSWTSTFHLVLLVSFQISSFLGALTIVEAQKGLHQRGNIEYTEGYRADESSFESDVPVAKQLHLVVMHHPVYEAREFLVEHNKIRKQIGEPPLVWDRTLAHYARRFAGQRAATCDMVHSQGPYGENIYWGATYYRHTAAAAVRAWAGETNDYNAMTNTCKPLKLCGHYKQIVWRSSTKLGCARVKCLNGGVYIICSYDPPGNYIGESPFETPVIAEGPPPQSSQTPPTPAAQTPPSPAQTTPTPVQTPPSPAQTTPTPVQTPPSPAQTTPTPPSPPS